MYWIMAPQHKSRDAGNSDVPEKLETASFKSKGKKSRLNKERKKSHAEIAKIYSKNKSSVHKIV